MTSELVHPEQFPKLFLEDVPLLDVRAEVEVKQGAIPNSINIPLLNTEERAQVGLCYKQKGNEAALALGHELVRDKIKEERLQRWVHFLKKNPHGVLYCLRGGQRSKITQEWLKERQVIIPRVRGGYKALRQFLLQTIEDVCAKANFLILCGRTGSGKTVVMRGRPNTVDLEALACHRGSAFGGMILPQPKTIDFENHLAVALLKKSREQDGPLLLEDESRLIGRVALPQNLYDKMSQSPCVELKTPLAERVDHILREYVIEALHAFNKKYGEEGFAKLAEGLHFNLKRISKKLGGTRYSEIHGIMAQALSCHREKGQTSHHRNWIEKLLLYYYDPFYDYSLEKKRERIVFSGNANEMQSWLGQGLKRSAVI